MTILAQAVALAFSALPMKCLLREYPNKMDHVMNNAGEVLSPRTLHPAFYGCFDWHSSVHGHWMLVKLLRTEPQLPNAKEIRKLLNQTLTSENIQVEVKYLQAEGRKSFERTYGWAWLLKLAAELHGWDDPDGKRWNEALKPLASAMSLRYIDFMPRQTYPIRTGVHPNTAFGLSFALDYSRAVKDEKLEQLIIERSKTYFLKDKEIPVQLEPGGEDFFSPSLMEASLMRRVLNQKDFTQWTTKFFSNFESKKLAPILTPAIVSDRTDPKLAHLDGLNLSRAWCMKEIASALPKGSPGEKLFSHAAEEHAKVALPAVASGHYEGDHWLASFAIYLLYSK
ncbi:MAG TPA: DUF2891 domain-containing protein [Bacteriovoracaceae bacterium]|nr:DUF2891 domain-containing protein [Bacteriovoracaceae bacterium]